jgi:branched-chain amino acid aminotransferase
MGLAAELRLEVREEPIPCELLYLADEVLFTASAMEITPVLALNRIPVGDWKRGPITDRLMTTFFDIVAGRVPETHGWLTPLSD